MNDKPYDRRLAAALARPLAGTPVTPNMITAVSLLAGLAAAALFATGERLLYWPAGLLLILSLLLDHADGELARGTGQTSRFGHLFDRLSTAVVHVLVFLALGIGESAGPLGGLAIVLGAASGLAIALIFLVRNWTEARHGDDAIEQPRLAGFEIQDVLYLVAPIAWLGLLTPLLVAAGIGAPVYLLITLVRARSGRA